MMFREGLKKYIKHFVVACKICQRNKYKALKPVRLLQPLSILTQVWEDVTMDFIERLPK